jgi:hypothetical protein
MNARLQELIEKSQRFVDGYTEIKAIDPERLAELIVLECVEIFDPKNFHGGAAIRAMIEDHFRTDYEQSN